MKKLFLVLTAFALSSLAFAKTYNLTLYQPTVVGESELKPGDYKLDLENEKAVIRAGKQRVEAAVKVESGSEKFAATSVRYRNGDGKYRLQEIRVGGTSTKVVFD
jgi:hypothetical protein